MKKRILYLIALFFSLAIFAQENNDSKDSFTYERINVINSKKGTLKITGGKEQKNTPNSVKSQNSGIGETPGALSVSLTGSSQYTIPIAVPAGVDGVVPQISLTYDSHAGNGLAGYGWNLSGISSISRIASTTFHDGIIDPVDFDNLDRFALDGKRLILKSGTYGGNGAVYETESYSNVKITSHGVSSYGANFGPAYFEVQYPDGSTAFYGETADSQSQTTYALTTWKNAQGVKINYEYDKESSQNSIVISKISYGGSDTTPHMNEIEFIYYNRSRVEQAYVHNISFVRKSLLGQIKVFSNNNRFRKYDLAYNDTSSLEYDRLTSVQERSGDGSLSHSPINFQYTNTYPHLTWQENTMQLGLLNIEQRNASAVTLDLTGNGKIDFIIKPSGPSPKDKFWVFKDLQNTTNNPPYVVNTNGLFEDLFSANILNHDNKVLEGRGFFVVQEGASNTIKFKAYTNGVSNPINFSYEKVWAYPPTYSDDGSCNSTQTLTVPHEYVSGDFNGDGLTDVIAITKPYTSRTCSLISGCSGGGGELTDEPIIGIDPPNESCCECSTSTSNGARATFIDLNRNVTSNFTKSLGYFGINLTGNNKVHAVDVNGDGKTDIVLLEEDKMMVYSLDSNDNLQLLWQLNDGQLSTSRPLLFGDYNGDGKTDFLNPTAVNSNSFGVYISTGTRFDKKVINQDFTYKEDLQVDNNTSHTNKLIPLDFNGDGKTDIIGYHAVGYSNSNNGLQKISIYSSIGRKYFDISSEHPSFDYRGGTTKYNNVTHFPIPIFLSSEETNRNLEFATISDQWVSSLNFTQDHREDMLLKSVESNGTTYNVEYNSLNSNATSSDNIQVYHTTSNLSYPYVDMQISPQTRVVTGIERVATGIQTIKQSYSYYGGVYHMEGLGFLGFQGVAGSNWHTDLSDRIFNVAKFDPVLRGALTEDYSQEVFFDFYSSPSSFISKTTYSNSSTLSSSKVFKLQVNSSTTTNALEGRTITTTNFFDSYNNTEKVTTTYTGGITSTVDYTYSNSTGSTYYIGRPLTVKRIMVNNGESFSTENEFFYTGMLLSEVKSKGNGSTVFDREVYTYDSFGNITKKTVTPHGGTSREVSFEYDNTGRFLTKSIDLEGRANTYLYNLNTGTISSEENYFSQITSYTYDAWNRVTQVTDFLGKNFDTSYSESNYEYTVSESGDDGSGRITIHDRLGRVRETSQKNALGNWVSVSLEYDALDRLHRKSEPYFNSNPSQWNVTNYDMYSRVISQNAYTGRFINIQYNGLSTTVDDGTKIVTTTKDGLGNVIQVVDPGGTVNYTYYGNNGIKSSNYGGNLITVEQDEWGRKTKMTDPSFGEFTYSYNGYGEMISEVSPKGTRSFVYDSKGKPLQETHQGEETDMLVNYTYNSDKQLTTISGNNVRTNEAFTYTYQYDTHHRPYIAKEQNAKAYFEHQFSYDAFGRVETDTYISNNLSNNTSSTVKVKNLYHTNSGEMIEILDFNTNTSLWKIDELDDKGRLTKSTLGNGIEKNKSFDTFGYLANITDKTTTNNPVQTTATDIDYSFDHQRGNLMSRNNKVFSWSETFQYDHLDRLLDVSGPNSKSHTYDDRGRITNNSHVGDYSYLTSSSYKLKDVQLNTQGDIHYQNNPIQQIKFNGFKKPVSIHSKGKGRVDFEYSIFKSRSHAYYGGEQEDKLLRRFQKHYSSITPVEIEEDSQGGTKIITYVGGNAYSSPIVHIKQTGSNPIDDYHYLHRDHLGSILAITDSGANIVEQRQFGAWGATDVFEKAGVNSDFDHTSLLNRGFTGHEHFFEVDLIHMNGRMYDPSLSRFLSPDNYVQDTFNTQNYNRYAYVMNNPLKYTDPSGEIVIETIIGVAIGSFAVFSVARALNYHLNGSSASVAFSNDVLSGATTGAIATGIPISDPGLDGEQPEQPWYVRGFNNAWEHQVGRFEGAIGAVKSTWDLAKSLTTWKGWEDLGTGYINMGHMTSLPLLIFGDKGKQLYGQLGEAIVSFVEKIPHMSSHELGYAEGFISVKIFEGILFSKGAGIVANNARNFASLKNVARFDYLEPLDVSKANNFFGRKYRARILDEDLIVYRGGDNVNPYGSWFSLDAPISQIQMRIDKAVRRYWKGGGESIVTHGYEFKVPKGTLIYEGPTGYQGGFYLGGPNQMQIYIHKPWDLIGTVDELILLTKYKLK